MDPANVSANKLSFMALSLAILFLPNYKPGPDCAAAFFGRSKSMAVLIHRNRTSRNPIIISSQVCSPK